MTRPEKIEQTLLKEAMQRISPSERVYDFNLTKQEYRFGSELLVEAENRLRKIKLAFLEKESMAAQAGVRDVRNSTANTVWSKPNPSESGEAIEDKIYNAFKKWLYTRAETGHHLPVNTGMNIQATPDSKFEGVPGSDMRMEFPFYRSILPTSPEFAANAQSSIGAFEQVIPRLNDFISALHAHSLPPNPYYHATVRTSKKGGVNKDQAVKFVLSKLGQEITKPNGEQLPNEITGMFYKEIAQRMQNPEDRNKVQMTIQLNRTRRYDREDIKELNAPSPVLRAIAFKMGQGYAVDWQALQKDLMGRARMLINEVNDYEHAHKKTRQLSPQERREIYLKKMGYKNYFSSVYDRLAEAFKLAGTPLGKEDPNEWSGIGGQFDQQQLRGFRVHNKGTRRSANVMARAEVEISFKFERPRCHLERSVLSSVSHPSLLFVQANILQFDLLPKLPVCQTRVTRRCSWSWSSRYRRHLWLVTPASLGGTAHSIPELLTH